MEKKALRQPPISQRPLFGPVKPLKPDQLRKNINADEFPFTTTEELEPAPPVCFPQPRAEKALELGINLKSSGHIFVCGSPDMRPKNFIDAVVQQHAERHSDICDYLAVCPSKETWFPLWVSLPAGHGRSFLKQVENSINACRERIKNQLLPRMLRSKEPLDKTYQAAWIEELNDLIEERIQPLNQQYGDQQLDNYLNALKALLRKKMKRILDLAVLYLLQDSRGPELQKIMDESDQFSGYCPILIHEPPESEIPIIFESNPTLSNLFGHVLPGENNTLSQSPNLFLLQPGSLLKAQGGYLILDFEEVANEPDVWKYLKEALKTIN